MSPRRLPNRTSPQRQGGSCSPPPMGSLRSPRAYQRRVRHGCLLRASPARSFLTTTALGSKAQAPMSIRTRPIGRARTALTRAILAPPRTTRKYICRRPRTEAAPLTPTSTSPPVAYPYRSLTTYTYTQTRWKLRSQGSRSSRAKRKTPVPSTSPSSFRHDCRAWSCPAKPRSTERASRP